MSSDRSVWLVSFRCFANQQFSDETFLTADTNHARTRGVVRPLTPDVAEDQSVSVLGLEESTSASRRRRSGSGSDWNPGCCTADATDRLPSTHPSIYLSIQPTNDPSIATEPLPPSRYI